jgi:hypothetical protein
MWPFRRPVLKAAPPTSNTQKAEETTKPQPPATYDLKIHHGTGSWSRYSFGALEHASRRFYELNDSLAKGDRVFMFSSASGSEIFVLRNITIVELTHPPLSRDAVGMG